MTDNELKETIKNLEIGNSAMGENEYVKIRKNVLESILENYKELLKLRELLDLLKLRELLMKENHFDRKAFKADLHRILQPIDEGEAQ